MNALIRTTLRIGVVAAAAALAAPTVNAQPDADMDAMMEAMEAMGAPGEQHKRLQHFVGKWDVVAKFYMYPGAEPTVSHCKAVVTSMFEGRFTREEFSGDFEMGGPEPVHFEGLGFNGFDNISQKYIYCWMDSFTTGIMTGEGTLDSSGKLYTFTSKNAPDPMTGGYKETQSKVKIIDDNKHVAEFFEKGPDGQWFRTMELTYKRMR